MKFNIKFFDFKKYIYFLATYNLTSIIFLYDTSSFNLGLVSLQSLFFSLNTYSFIFFLFFETLSAFLDKYGLTFYFLKILPADLLSLNLKFIFYIFFENYRYLFFLIINLFLVKKSNFILNFALNLKINIKNLYILFLSFFVFFIILISNEKILNKVKLIKEKSLIRSDNWLVNIYSTLNYSIKNEVFNFKFENAFNNYENLNNIYIIINESYPNFKDTYVKNSLTSTIFKNLDKNIEVKKYKKNWSKNYSTLGAELSLFCDSEKNFSEFKSLNNNFHLNEYFKKHNCWIKRFQNYHNIYIHSYNANSFNRDNRYSTKMKRNDEESFFNEIFFKEDLIAKNLNICVKNYSYIGICETQILENFLNKFKNINKNKLIIYLTLENHIPIIVNKNLDLKICKKKPINLHPQFCSIYLNQLKFNKSLNKFINNLEKDDLLVFFSDTPPLYSQRDRIHFEDYVDVFFFKNNSKF